MYGDTTVIRRHLDHLRERAVDIRSEAHHLLGRAEGVAWSGRAAETMRARARERAVRLRGIAEQHELAAAALEKHLVTVDDLKERIARAERALRGTTRTAPPPGHKDWLEVTGR